MKLTPEQQQKATERLSEFLSRSCEVCPGNAWLLNDAILELREFQKGTISIGGTVTVFPIIAVTCQSCGNSHFFNALLLGIINKQDA